jgi:FtsP/CotA-like multicopper oxidase with cupredoxin domain
MNPGLFLYCFGHPGATLAPPPHGAPPPQPGYPYLQPSFTQIKIDFTNIDKGTFVFHCHMLFHEDHGMMGVVHLY